MRAPTFPVNSQVYPKVQVITVTQLLQGERPKLPQRILLYIQATKAQAAVAARDMLDL